MSQILCDRSHIRAAHPVGTLSKNMKSIADILFQKETELARVKKEVEALKLSARILEEQVTQADELLTLTTFALALDRRLSKHRNQRQL